MDEMPIAFNMPNQTTIEEFGTQTISILITDYEYTCFTFPDSVYVHANPSSWMNEKEMICIEEEGESNELGSENIEDVEDNESNN
ncbi:6222_t:CDS:2, partial [Scutellospora calospora]